MRNQELKKELGYWEANKTQKEELLEREVDRLNEILSEAKDKMKQFKTEQEKEVQKIYHLRNK